MLNAGYAHVIGFGPIIMGEQDLLNVHFLLPQAKIVAVHMEAINRLMASIWTATIFACGSRK